MSIIDIDISYLLKNNITAQDFIIAYWLVFGTAGVAKLLEKFPVDQASKQRLINANILRDVEGLEVTDEFKRKFDKNVYFYEFYEAYPVYTVRPGGQKEYLRISPTSVRDKYNKIVKGNPTIHKMIMDTLYEEITERTNKGGMAYMKRMTNWLNDESWLARAEAEKEHKYEDPGYGQSVE